VLPIIRAFQPDLVLIGCGAEAAKEDLLGDCGLTPGMFYIMTQTVIEPVGWFSW
jgi:acetoin utilization deacetylase AcuC-like enzyme